MIVPDNFDKYETLWKKRFWFIGEVRKTRLTYAPRVVENIEFKLFGFDVHLSKTTAK